MLCLIAFATQRRVPRLEFFPPMSRTIRSKALSVEQCGEVFGALGRLEAAGLPAVQAATLLEQGDRHLRSRLLGLRRRLAAGKAIAQAGLESGLFSESQSALIDAAERSGKLAEVYRHLAEHYTGWARRIRQIRSRFYLPASVLLLALIVQPLPDLFAARITGWEYFSISLGRFLVLGLAIVGLLKLPVMFARLGLLHAFHSALLAMPGVSKMIVRRERNAFLFMLALQLEAGLAFSEALPGAVAGIKNSAFRVRFRPALNSLGSGASVAETFSQVSCIPGSILQVIDQSEKSGKLASGLLHFTRLESESIRVQDDQFAEWLPRIVYFSVLGWLAGSMVGVV